jgi:hypothetical protein
MLGNYRVAAQLVASRVVLGSTELVGYSSSYTLSAKYCRNKLKHGGVCIYVHKSLSCLTIELEKCCKEQDFEVCAIKLYLASVPYCIITICISPVGNFFYFLNTLDTVLNKLYSVSSNIILCGYVNINYFGKSSNKSQLVSLLATYSLFNIVNFTTRIDNKSSTAIEGMFIDKYKFKNYSIFSMPDGLSDHDAQLLTLNNLKIQNTKSYSYIKQQINKASMENFKLNLSYETWEEIFLVMKWINNSFLNIYFRVFNDCFPIKNYFAIITIKHG